MHSTRIHTLSIWARMPSWLLCLVVSLTRSFAWLANCSKSEPCEPCLSTPFPVPEPLPLLPPLFCRIGTVGDDCCLCVPTARVAAVASDVCLASNGLTWCELKLEVRASTLPTLGWRCRHVGLIGGTCFFVVSVFFFFLYIIISVRRMGVEIFLLLFVSVEIGVYIYLLCIRGRRKWACFLFPGTLETSIYFSTIYV